MKTEPAVQIVAEAESHRTAVTENKETDVKSEAVVKVISTELHDTPTYSTTEEAKAFNKWYDEVLQSKKLKKKKACLNSSSVSSVHSEVCSVSSVDDWYDEVTPSDLEVKCACSEENKYKQLQVEQVTKKSVFNMVGLQALIVIMVTMFSKVKSLPFSNSTSFSFPAPRDSYAEIYSSSPVETSVLITRTRVEVYALARDWVVLIKYKTGTTVKYLKETSTNAAYNLFKNIWGMVVKIASEVKLKVTFD